MPHDRTFEDYQNAVHELVRPDAIAQQVARSTPSDKFTQRDRHWYAVPFPGVTLITPPFCDDRVNTALYIMLADIQQDLLHRLGMAHIGLLPPSSLHLTIADLLAAQPYRDYVQAPQADATLRDRVAATLDDLPIVTAPRLRVQGVSAYGTAVTVVLAFESAAGYAPVMRFRDAIYSSTDPALRRLAPFTAHISLFYKQAANSEAKADLVAALHAVNEAIEWDALPAFVLHRVDMRDFADMTQFTRRAGWPQYAFG